MRYGMSLTKASTMPLMMKYSSTAKTIDMIRKKDAGAPVRPGLRREPAHDPAAGVPKRTGPVNQRLAVLPHTSTRR
jgi:hypothetical protein